MPEPIGFPKTGGRKKGTRNKLTRDLKEMIVNALNGAGGEEYLKKQAEKSPAAFLALVGRVLPLQVHGGDGGPILIVTGIPKPGDLERLGREQLEQPPPIDVTPSSSKLH